MAAGSSETFWHKDVHVKRFLFALAFVLPAALATAADPPPAEPLDHAGLAALLEKSGYKIKDNKLGFTLYVGNRENWFIEVTETQDKTAVYLMFYGGTIPDKYDRSMPLKLLKENGRGTPTFFGIAEKTNMVFLSYMLPNRNLTLDVLKQAVTELTIAAARTTLLWDTRLWPAPTD
jgi:hypothetical protein